MINTIKEEKIPSRANNKDNTRDSILNKILSNRIDFQSTIIIKTIHLMILTKIHQWVRKTIIQVTNRFILNLLMLTSILLNGILINIIRIIIKTEHLNNNINNKNTNSILLKTHQIIRPHQTLIQIQLTTARINPNILINLYRK